MLPFEGNLVWANLPVQGFTFFLCNSDFSKNKRDIRTIQLYFNSETTALPLYDQNLGLKSNIKHFINCTSSKIKKST